MRLGWRVELNRSARKEGNGLPPVEADVARGVRRPDQVHCHHRACGELWGLRGRNIQEWMKLPKQVMRVRGAGGEGEGPHRLRGPAYPAPSALAVLAEAARVPDPTRPSACPASHDPRPSPPEFSVFPTALFAAVRL